MATFITELKVKAKLIENPNKNYSAALARSAVYE